ncbi:MAG: hypothetical protein [Bacteriophage sp.]|nr:MAG: hypothetical protein [Bacteriophage sp.]
MSEDTIRAAHRCLDIEPWQSKQRGDKIIVTASRWTAEITGQQYDKEAVAKYLAAVSPENIAWLLALIDGLRYEIKEMQAAKDYSLSEDIGRDLIKLAMRANIELQRGNMAKKEPAG